MTGTTYLVGAVHRGTFDELVDLLWALPDSPNAGWRSDGLRGYAEVHRLTPFARVDGERITCPAPLQRCFPF
jgi:hypothetical protein